MSYTSPRGRSTASAKQRVREQVDGYLDLEVSRVVHAAFEGAGVGFYGVLWCDRNG